MLLSGLALKYLGSGANPTGGRLGVQAGAAREVQGSFIASGTSLKS